MRKIFRRLLVSIFEDTINEEVELRVKTKEEEIIRLKELAELDGMTKTYNKRTGIDNIKRLVATTNLITFCYIDINDLKIVNDNFGHKIGDELICSVVNAIKSEIRKNDFIIRMGGDEFLIVLSDTTEEMAECIWNRILKRFNAINREEGRIYDIIASHGIKEYDIEKKIEDDIALVDNLMYQEKRKIKSNK